MEGHPDYSGGNLVCNPGGGFDPAAAGGDGDFVSF